MDKTGFKSNREVTYAFKVANLSGLITKERLKMIGNQSLIAYTVMVERSDGKWMFLVQHEKVDFVFPGIDAAKDTNQTGLASVIDAMKQKLSLDYDKVELIELTNAITPEHRVPLFVFKYHCGAEHMDDLLLPQSNLEWQISDSFKETIKKYEISGVPLF